MKDENRSVPGSIASELLATGARLWSSVECDVKGDCLVIYAQLSTVAKPDVCDVLMESKEVMNNVLQRRFGAGNWLATVHWNGRLSYTFARNNKT